MAKSRIRNTQQLRTFLVEQMEGVANGEIDTERARGVANIAQQVYNTINIEIKVALAKSKLEEGALKPVSFE